MNNFGNPYENRSLGPISQAIELLATDNLNRKRREEERRKDELWEAKKISSDRKREDELLKRQGMLNLVSTELARKDITPEYRAELMKASGKVAGGGKYEFNPDAFGERYTKIQTPDYLKKTFPGIPEKLSQDEFDRLDKSMKAQMGYGLKELEIAAKKQQIETEKRQGEYYGAQSQYTRERSRGGKKSDQYAELDQLIELRKQYVPKVDASGVVPGTGNMERLNAIDKRIEELSKELGVESPVEQTQTEPGAEPEANADPLGLFSGGPLGKTSNMPGTAGLLGVLPEDTLNMSFGNTPRKKLPLSYDPFNKNLNQ